MRLKPRRGTDRWDAGDQQIHLDRAPTPPLFIVFFPERGAAPGRHDIARSASPAIQCRRAPGEGEVVDPSGYYFPHGAALGDNVDKITDGSTISLAVAKARQATHDVKVRRQRGRCRRTPPAVATWRVAP